MITTDKESNWFIHLVTVTAVYGTLIWFSLPPDDRMYLSLKALQAYRRWAWDRWIKRTPGWLVEALQVRGRVPIE